MSRFYHSLFEPVSGLTHALGAMATLLGSGWLVWQVWGEWSKAFGLVIYGLSSTAMFLASTLLHGVKPRPRLHFLLNRLDHMAIFLVNAGTYTPIVVTFFPAGWPWPVLLTVGVTAVSGILYKLFSRRIHGVSKCLHLPDGELGWGAAAHFGGQCGALAARRRTAAAVGWWPDLLGGFCGVLPRMAGSVARMFGPP